MPRRTWVEFEYLETRYELKNTGTQRVLTPEGWPTIAIDTIEGPRAGDKIETPGSKHDPLSDFSSSDPAFRAARGNTGGLSLGPGENYGISLDVAPSCRILRAGQYRVRSRLPWENQTIESNDLTFEVEPARVRFIQASGLVGFRDRRSVHFNWIHEGREGNALFGDVRRVDESREPTNCGAPRPSISRDDDVPAARIDEMVLVGPAWHPVYRERSSLFAGVWREAGEPRMRLDLAPEVTRLVGVVDTPSALDVLFLQRTAGRDALGMARFQPDVAPCHAWSHPLPGRPVAATDAWLHAGFRNTVLLFDDAAGLKVHRYQTRDGRLPEAPLVLSIDGVHAVPNTGISARTDEDGTVRATFVGFRGADRRNIVFVEALFSDGGARSRMASFSLPAAATSAQAAYGSSASGLARSFVVFEEDGAFHASYPDPFTGALRAHGADEAPRGASALVMAGRKAYLVGLWKTGDVSPHRI